MAKDPPSYNRFLGTLGVLLFLFLAGLEIEIEKIKETSRDSIIVSLSSVLVPFALGFLLITVFFPEYGFLSALICLTGTNFFSKIRGFVFE